LRIGDGGFGFLDGRVGFGIWDLGNWFVDWGREALEKKLGNFDLRKGFAKHTVGRSLEGRRLELVGEED
jgi:hypothetical protein